MKDKVENCFVKFYSVEHELFYEPFIPKYGRAVPLNYLAKLLNSNSDKIANATALGMIKQKLKNIYISHSKIGQFTRTAPNTNAFFLSYFFFILCIRVNVF